MTDPRALDPIRPAADDHPVLVVIGHVESPLTDPARAPKQGSEGAPDAWLAFRAEVGDGLADLREGDEVIVLTWLDRADRSTLRVHPRDDPARPLTGVFSTRSADRPNPVGLHRVRILEAAGGRRFLVRGLEAVHGTPILDLKPVLAGAGEG
jgi:tRNA-Thr(GGU) m(6)t(6)A37 methyltransferase TsaA